MNLKLRNRIAIYYTIILAMILAISFFGIYKIVNNSLITSLDSKLVAESEEIQAGLDLDADSVKIKNYQEWHEAEHAETTINPIFIQIFNPDFTTAEKSENLGLDYLTPQTNLTSGKIYQTSLAQFPVRQLQKQITNTKGKIIGHLLVAVSRNEIEQLLKNLRITLIIIFPFSLLIAFVLSKIIAGSSISPVKTIIETAQNVTQKNLDKRLPIPKHRDELYFLTESLNDLLDRLQKALLVEKQFTADASHELRTPLTALKGTLEVILRRPRTTEYYEDKLPQLLEEVNKITILVDQLLLLARVDSIEKIVRKQNSSINSLLTRVIQRFEPLLLNKNIDVVYTSFDELETEFDQELTEIAFNNILANAIKYSLNASEILIDVDADLKQVSIINSGESIPQKEIASVFERFYRVENVRNSNISGAGLGLSIVKRFLDIQKIKFDLSTTGDSKTVFKIYFK
ncbi:MAG: HAMP domain-containing protein [Melioribacteraceae bacterium]|nr:HAMP domain-containing protein [Melioribacteraceae bacterium]MCF8263704.1 HAMP domain-containing protein [Melioribacteraceae bacterium]MCF8413571.1 HAMP domain-containing protein [Melioribacteraceae bacterium]MCF8432282.1 HAMP domain-containing protein [Melioribacteraceae bacterium]